MLSPDTFSARTDVLGRYGKFARGLRTSVSQEIRVLFNYIARDMRSTTARNIKLVKEKSGLDPMVTGAYKLKEAVHNSELVDIPAHDKWRVQYTRSLLSQLQEAKYLVQDDKVVYLQSLIDSLVR